eukprot:COSAG02_NODE_609_length_19574_cov_18.178537_16_plen_68_part_00
MRRRKGSPLLGATSSASSNGGDEDDWAQWERSRKQVRRARAKVAHISYIKRSSLDEWFNGSTCILSG